MSEEPPYWVIFNGERTQGGHDGAAAAACRRTGSRTSSSIDIEAAAQTAQARAARRSWGRSRCPTAAASSLIADPQGAPFGILEGEMDD